MVTLKWKVNGRTVPSNRVADELGKSIKQAAADKVRHAITGVRCPVHGGAASNIRVENMGSEMNFTFNACCDGLKQAIAARLREHQPTASGGLLQTLKSRQCSACRDSRCGLGVSRVLAHDS